MMSNYHYPSDFEEFKEGCQYQVLFPMSKLWGEVKTFTSNICNTKKQNIRRLIKQTRIRIIR